MRVSWKPVATILTVAAVAGGCARAERAPEADVLRPAAVAEKTLGHPREAAALAAVSMKAAVPGALGSAAAASPSLGAVFAAVKLIRNAELAIEVPRYEQAAAQVSAIATSFGGYVAGAQSTRGHQGMQSGSITIRVPSERFQDALAALQGVGSLRSETVSTQDVTKQYADLETRLATKRDTAQRLRELLRTRTADLADVLNAERELARVNEEIEQMEGERRFFDHEVALSTLTLALSEPQALVEPGIFAPLGRAFREATTVLTQSLAAMVYIVVAMAPWLLLAWIAWRVARATWKRKRSTPAAA